MTKTGFSYDDIYLEHEVPAGFLERPERLSAIVERLKETELLAQLTELKYAPDVKECITALHAPAYVQRVKESCEKKLAFIDTSDMPLCPRSYDVAVAAAGAAVAAVDAVIAQKVRNAFCAVRPPGHHALHDKAMGFCLFNNVAIAARRLQQQHQLAKILIVDWDVHHGNGTQAAFYEDPSVLFFSVHQHPFYPGSGLAGETGAGPGKNFTINAPLPAGCGDREYFKVFEEKLLPAAREFKPDFVLISAGFDAQQGDLIGDMQVTPEGFATLTQKVMEFADAACGGRIVSVLEGGYHLKALARSTEAHLRALLS